MCYWITLANGHIIAETTVQHVTRDELNDVVIKSQIECFGQQMTERMNDTNFDNLELANFHLNDDLSLLDKHIRD